MPETSPVPPATPSESRTPSVLRIDLDRIRPNREQPRKHFDEPALQELARSIQEQGVIQPIVVRSVGDGGFELLVGERRWRAAQIAGLLKIPAIVQDVAEDRVLEVALIENIQREQLNPIEFATALQKLIGDLGLTQEAVAERIGKPRSTVANVLRLLALPGAIQEHIREGRISLGQAKALASLESPGEQREVADQIVKKSLSVREVEKLVARLHRERPGMVRRSDGAADPNVAAAETQLQHALGTKVRIHQNAKGGGRIEILVHSGEEMNRIFRSLLRAGQAR